MAPFGYIPPPSTGGGGGGGAGEVEIAVTVSNNKFVLDGVEQQDFTVLPGMIYKFDVSSSTISAPSPSHVFGLSTSAESGAYTDGVTTSTEAQGSAGAWLKWDVPLDVADTIYYRCTAHTGMGGELTLSLIHI